MIGSDEGAASAIGRGEDEPYTSDVTVEAGSTTVYAQDWGVARLKLGYLGVDEARGVDY